MKEFKIVPMCLETDKEEMESWETTFAAKPEFDGILHYVLEDNIYYGLGEVIETNFEIFPIGKDEAKHAFSVKAEDGEIIGFLISTIFGLTTKNPELHFGYIVLKPNHQSQGYASAILTEFFENSKKYLGAKPTEIFAYIHKSNNQSINLFKKFGFDFSDKHGPDYFKAIAKMPEIQKRIDEERAKNKQ